MILMKIMQPGNNSNEPLSDESTESHELGWIQQSSQGNNWADPAPHHNHAHFTDDVVVDVATTDNEAPSSSHTKNS